MKVLAVEPQCLGIDRVFLGEVDHRIAAVDAFQPKRVNQFLP